MSNRESNDKSKNINKSISELDEKIAWFYSDDFSLDRATENYKSAVNLAKQIEEDLENLKNDIKILGHDFTR